MLVLLPVLTAALSLGTAAVSATPPDDPAGDPPSEHEMKAVFLYNFAKFVDWPPDAFRDAAAPILVCVLGDDPFGGALDATTRGERVNRREILVRRVTLHGGARAESDALRGCHILFVSSSERKRLDRIFDALRGANVLTVGEMDDFARLGGVVHFTKERYRIGFEINVHAADQANLHISSKLLSLARVVDPASGAAAAGSPARP